MCLIQHFRTNWWFSERMKQVKGIYIIGKATTMGKKQKHIFHKKNWKNHQQPKAFNNINLGLKVRTFAV